MAAHLGLHCLPISQKRALGKKRLNNASYGGIWVIYVYTYKFGVHVFSYRMLMKVIENPEFGTVRFDSKVLQKLHVYILKKNICI